MAILEALACATPVVISDQCHFPEVAAAQAGMVVTLDPVEVAKGLDAILGDRILARQMGENGRRMIFETFTWPRIAEMTLRAYEASACAAPASGRRARTGFAGFPT